MTRLVEAVTATLGGNYKVSGKLRKQGCTVSLRGAPGQRLIVDFDKPGSMLETNQTRCDYLVVANGEGSSGWIAPLELKKGSLQAGKVVRQLRAGAAIAEQIFSQQQHVRQENVKFRPTAAFGSIHKAQRNKLKHRSNKVRFHSHIEAIRLIKCGDMLTRALGS